MWDESIQQLPESDTFTLTLNSGKITKLFKNFISSIGVYGIRNVKSFMEIYSQEICLLKQTCDNLNKNYANFVYRWRFTIIFKLSKIPEYNQSTFKI